MKLYTCKYFLTFIAICSLNSPLISSAKSNQLKPLNLLETSYFKKLPANDYIAGGTKVFKGPVTFLRINNNGSIDRRVFRYREREKRGSYGNPNLKNGDLIFRGNSAISTFNEITNEITDSISGVFSTYEI